jgi:hypothetical protein
VGGRVSRRVRMLEKSENGLRGGKKERGGARRGEKGREGARRGGKEREGMSSEAVSDAEVRIR